MEENTSSPEGAGNPGSTGPADPSNDSGRPGPSENSAASAAADNVDGPEAPAPAKSLVSLDKNGGEDARVHDGPDGPESGEVGGEPAPAGIGGEDGDGGEAPKPFFGKVKIALLAALAAFIVFLAIAPTLLLRFSLNRALEPGSGWSRMAASSARVSPFLTGFRVEGLSFFAEGADAPAFTVESVTGSGLRPLAVLTAVFGKGEILTLISGDGQVTARGASFERNGVETGFKSGKLDTLYASGLNFDSSAEGAIGGAELKSLRIGGLQLDAFNETLRVDSFSLAGLSGGVVGRISAGGIEYRGGDEKALSVEGFSVGGLDLKLAALPGNNPLSFSLSLFEALDSLDLDHFSLQSEGSEAAYVRSAKLDYRTDEAGKPLKKFEASGVRLGLRKLLYLGDGPEGAAVLAAFGENPEGSLEFSAEGAPGGGPRKLELKIAVDGALEAGFTQNVSRIPSLPAVAADPMGSALVLLGSQIGEGGVYYIDGGAAARLYPVLSERSFGGAPAAGALKEALLPAVRGLDPAKVVNAAQLEGEVAIFLDEPRSLGVSWRPALGFPGSVAAKSGLLSGSGPLGSGAKEPLQYTVLREMNVTVSVNGRAPMGVVMAQ
ncbi:MAG: hypothetical protein LBQ12_09600 [Deltaproteobacteria bacterium]|jgi:hypothetical protein|nr:hypothetical protein [Deltaproteobacteria bacterium]